MDDAKGKVESPVIGLSLNAQFAAGRTVVFQTHVPQDVTAEGLGVILEKLNGVADREEAFYAQDQARRQLEVEEKAVANMQRRLSDIDSNIRLKMSVEGKRNPKPSGNDEMQKKQALDTLEEGKRRVAECKDFLAKLIVKAGNRDGASVSADR
jgi:hypothetical protein